MLLTTSMPIDDHPFDALEQQLRLEDPSTSPTTKIVRQFVSLVPLKWPFDKIAERLTGHLAADSVSRIRLMLETCMSEVRKHDEDIRRINAALTEKGSEAREEALRDLLLDAAHKADNTRARERVRRIGLILANTVAESKQTEADEIEEMMRVAMDLSDHDIGFLQELVRIEGRMLQHQDHIPRYDAHTTWEHGRWGNRVDPEIDSVFSKLESYGLVARLAPPNNLNIMADFQNRYALLKKGLRLVNLIRESARGD
jgi:chemotaxis protein histidine kinase CheA